MMLHRIVAMQSRMAMKFDSVGESSMEHDTEIDYDNEHRVAEYEHDAQSRRIARTMPST
jgi:hypothetical protein